MQDPNAPGWLQLLERIDQCTASRQEVFEPLSGLTGPERAQVLTLPASIGSLVNVRQLRLYDSHLVRIPPEIGHMRSLADLDVYT